MERGDILIEGIILFIIAKYIGIMRHGEFNLLVIFAGVFIGASVPLVASSPTLLGLLLVLGVILALILPGRSQLIFCLGRNIYTSLGLSICCVLIFWLPGVVGSENFSRSFGVWARVAGMLLAATFLYHFLVRFGLDWCLRALILASIFSAIISLLGIFVATPIYSLFRVQELADINSIQVLKYYGSAVACLLPVVVWSGFQLGNYWRVLGIIYIPLAIGLIITLSSLSGLFGLMVGVAVGGMIGLLHRLELMRGYASHIFLSLFMLILLSILVFIFYQLPTTPSIAEIENGIYSGSIPTNIPEGIIDAHRQYIWGFVLDASLQAPYFGHGIDTSNFLPGASVLIEKFNQSFVPSHPHSWILEILSETGAFGLFALLVALSCLLNLWLKIARIAPGTGACGIALFFAFWSSSMLNFSIWAAWWQTVFLILTVIVLASGYRAFATKL